MSPKNKLMPKDVTNLSGVFSYIRKKIVIKKTTICQKLTNDSLINQTINCADNLLFQTEDTYLNYLGLSFKIFKITIFV